MQKVNILSYLKLEFDYFLHKTIARTQYLKDEDEKNKREMKEYLSKEYERLNNTRCYNCRFLDHNGEYYLCSISRENLEYQNVKLVEYYNKNCKYFYQCDNKKRFEKKFGI